ncbi:hypothetical protein BMF94_0433 [Rhodotorula taiwanensis]|uniref:F-box domain-containing protein n=1 Tax=Rhodotorula taiwanensis TaxID=741276 RepID=A0A2S5BHI6_9BASI|nr:hypothetical protein BMF94_0433 [Rhodotorula taiwanensis]
MATPSAGASLPTLPDEMLRLVFSGISASAERARLARVRRRLHPLAMEHLYRNVVCWGARERNLLARTFEARPDLQNLVRKMSLYSEPQRNRSTADGTDREEKPGCPTPDALRAFLRLPACVELSLWDVRPSVLHSAFGATSALAKVNHLSLRFDPFEDDDDATWWANLAQVPSLTHLSLSAPDEIPSPTAADSLTHVRHLDISVDLAPPFDVPLSTTFPSLQELLVYNFLDPDALEHVLSTAPPGLTTLFVMTDDAQDIVATHLSRYEKLSKLRLSTQLRSRALRKSLAASPISHLALDAGCTEVDRFLTCVLRNCAQLRRLAELVLDHVWTLTGNGIVVNLRDANVLRSAHKAVLFRNDLADDMRPDWPDGSSAEGLSYVLELARKAGVRVSGSALECLNWERDFEEQFKRFLVQKSIETKDYGALERHYGREEAGDAIVRYQPDLADLVAEANRRREEQRMAEV